MNLLRLISNWGGLVLDPDAAAFITAAGITNYTQKKAVNQLVLDLKANSLWTKMKAVYPMVGGTATTHKYNLVNPADTDAAFRLVFSGTWTHSATGAKPSGGAYADTFFRTSNLTNYNTSSSLGIYCNNTPFANWNIGLWNASFFGAFALGWRVDRAVFDMGIRTETLPAPASGFLVGSCTASNLRKMYSNGSLLTTNTTENTTGNLAANCYLGSSNPNGISGTAQVDIKFAFFAEGLSDANATAFYTAVQAFQTTLGRQV